MTEAPSLFGPVTSDLASVEDGLQADIDRDPPEVGAPMAELFAAGGKRIRPALVLLAARCGRYDLERLRPAAMAVELTHAATLVHDDVIDRSTTRRGRPTVAATLGDEPAIVIGDFYFARAYEHAARTGVPEVVGWRGTWVEPDIDSLQLLRLCQTTKEARRPSIPPRGIARHERQIGYAAPLHSCKYQRLHAPATN